MSRRCSAVGGRTRITTSALTTLVKTAAADELRVRPRQVAATVTDDGGALAVSVESPLPLEQLGEISVPVVRRVEMAALALRARLSVLSALEVTRVDFCAVDAVPLRAKRVY